MKIADKGTRFANFIIDKIAVLCIIILHTAILDWLLHIIPEDGSPWLGLYFFVIYFGYHFIFEYFFNRTVGTFITNTKVVDKNGDKPNAKTLFIRNMGRLIPFDNISFLSEHNGWHDIISNTEVVYV